ncbi:MAG: photosystem I reaction center subunit IV [Proteobacteria bacterium]|nr:photosystem I reaction center subunit IV [Pseudomonadota bacterium]
MSDPLLTHFFPLRRFPKALVLGLICLLTNVPGANAAIDLLERPARQSPLASKSMMLAVARAGDRLVAAGERGIIIYSDDRGVTWKQSTVPVSVTLTSLFFVSPEIGWATGHDGVILLSTDAGLSWRKQFDGRAANGAVLRDLQARVEAARIAVEKAAPNSREAATIALDAWKAALEDASAGAEFGPSRPLLGLWFRSVSEGFAIGSFGQLFYTADGGKSWASCGGRISNPDGYHYNAITVLDDGSLIIAGEAGKLRRSRDQGKTWETLDTGYSGHLYGVLGLSNSTLLTFGFAGNVLRSDDDGHTWKAQPRLINKTLVGGSVLPDGRVLLLAADRSLLISLDHGQTFMHQKTHPGRPVAAFLPLDKGILIVGGGGASILNLDDTTR